MSSPGRLVLAAPAKVNLTLAVGARRPDGFHAVESLCLALTLADRLTVERLGPGGRIDLEVSGPAAEGVPADETNLVWRAARGVQEWARRAGRTVPRLALRLEKHVPGQAGLGGGSSDAAAAALGCARLLGLDPDQATLPALLAELGSDCPFFLIARHTGLALCSGRGEIVRPLADSFPWWLVVATPDFGCATGPVYGAYRAADAVAPLAASGPETSSVRAAWPGGAAPFGAALSEARARLRNDLERAAERIEPRLGRFRAQLQEIASGLFQLSGSGSSCFALLSDEASARALATRVAEAARARRFGLRGLWVTRASGAGAGPGSSRLQFEGLYPP